MENNEIEVLATFVHGALAGLHGLGLVYNAYRKNHTDALLHGLALTYDFVAFRGHLRAVQEGEQNNKPEL